MIPFRPKTVRYGIFALGLEGRKTIENEGHLVWTLDDMLKT